MSATGAPANTKDDAVSKRCTCIKCWSARCPVGKGRFRASAKTTSWEQAEGIARQYESAAAGGKDMEAAMSMPTVEDAVDAYLSDARARGLVEETLNTDYFPQAEFAIILAACARLDEGLDRAYDVEKRGARLLPFAELAIPSQRKSI